MAHTLLLGATGAGKSFCLAATLQAAQKYEPLTFIFDLGGSYESLTRVFGGTYLNVGMKNPGFTINPFSLEPTDESWNFLFLFLRVLIESGGRYELTPEDEKALFAAIERAYKLPAPIRTLTNVASILGPLGEPQQLPAAQTTAAGSKHTPEVNIDAAHGRPYVIFEGTTIDTVLTNRLDSDFAGPVKVMVTNPIYSRDRQHVLIPAGTFILGDTQKVGSMGQRRLAVTFHRMIMPDGYSVDLDQFHGLDQAGDTGLKDKVNHHYLQIFGASIALGIIAGAAESTTYGGYTESGSDMYRQGMASSLSQSSADVLDRFINIPPTITIREGHRIKIYLTQDMLLPAYENHDMPGVM